MYSLVHTDLAKALIEDRLAASVRKAEIARAFAAGVSPETPSRARHRIGSGLIRLGLRVMGDRAWA